MKFNYPEMVTIPVKGMRFYESPEGNFYPSITTVLGLTVPEEKKKSLEAWRTSLGPVKADAKTKAAADNGTAVHLLIERYLKKEDLFQGEKFSSENINYFNALKLKLNKIDEVWGLEIPLVSNLLEIAGRCDCVGIYKGEPAIIDFKTSTSLKSADKIEDYYLQLCAYSIMHNEIYDTSITRGVILMSSNGGFPQEFNVNLLDYVDLLIQRVDKFYQHLDDKIN